VVGVARQAVRSMIADFFRVRGVAKFLIAHAPSYGRRGDFAIHSPVRLRNRVGAISASIRVARLAHRCAAHHAPPMKLRPRYLTALIVNVALPWLVYRLAFPHWGHLGALAASALPLLAWMSWELLRYRHFDALSALVLVGIVLSLLAMSISLAGNTRLRAIEEPMVSGMVGVSFLVSLALPRPLVFYLARSTMSREDYRSVESFERHWRERPTLVAYIRLMTLVWGIGMTGENVLRSLIVWQWPGDPRSAIASNVLRYGVYAGLTAWTFWCRRLIKRDALRYPDDTVSEANHLAS